jgi:hypothetical protein
MNGRDINDIAKVFGPNAARLVFDEAIAAQLKIDKGWRQHVVTAKVARDAFVSSGTLYPVSSLKG